MHIDEVIHKYSSSNWES